MAYLKGVIAISPNEKHKIFQFVRMCCSATGTSGNAYTHRHITRHLEEGGCTLDNRKRTYATIPWEVRQNHASSRSFNKHHWYTIRGAWQVANSTRSTADTGCRTRALSCAWVRSDVLSATYMQSLPVPATKMGQWSERHVQNSHDFRAFLTFRWRNYVL